MVEFMEEKKINKYNKHMIRRFKRNNAIFVGLSVFLGIVLVVFIYNFLLLPSISLNASRYIEIGYKDEGIKRQRFISKATGKVEDEYITGLLKEEWKKTIEK